MAADTAADELLEDINEMEWPLRFLSDVLVHDVFHAVWEVRHGAASALREILAAHGSSIGREAGLPLPVQQRRNAACYEDLIIRMLCIFALDRFGDYVSDTTVAPVRETCAQTLGAILKHVEPLVVEKVVDSLLLLTAHDLWEVRHGGALGLKYVVVVRQDLMDRLLPRVLPSLIAYILDGDDDVRAVAADSLLPVVNHIVGKMPDQVPLLVSTLWDCLVKLNDITSSTTSIMGLLSALLSECMIVPTLRKEVGLGADSEVLAPLVQRLLPFLRHSSTQVRRATLTTIQKLVTVVERGVPCRWLDVMLEPLLRHIYQGLLFENEGALVSLGKALWTAMMDVANPAKMGEVVNTHFASWCLLASAPVGSVLDVSLVLVAKHSAPVVVKGGRPIQAQESDISDGHVGLARDTWPDERVMEVLRICSWALGMAALATRMDSSDCIQKTLLRYQRPPWVT